MNEIIDGGVNNPDIAISRNITRYDGIIEIPDAKPSVLGIQCGIGNESLFPAQDGNTIIATGTGWKLKMT